jgi:uncharacterized protein (TIGR02391 family)
MAGRRSGPQQPAQPQIREFRSLEEIDQGIAKIKRRIGDVQSLDARSVRWDDQQPRNVEENIHATLLEVFGAGSPEHTANGEYRFVSPFSAANIGGDFCQNQFAKSVPQAAAMLENLVARLEEKRADLGGNKTGRVRTAFEGLDLHPRVAGACADLYRDKHYADAVLRASLALENFVKEKSGRYDLSGSALMEQAFTPNAPALAFNALADQSDKDEQRGMMLLFQGTVFAFRNPRAHKLLEDSPEEALESIALISLLAKRLEQAKLVKKS